MLHMFQSLPRTAPVTGDQVCKYMGPWRTFLVQTTTLVFFHSSGNPTLPFSRAPAVQEDRLLCNGTGQ